MRRTLLIALVFGCAPSTGGVDGGAASCPTVAASCIDAADSYCDCCPEDTAFCAKDACTRAQETSDSCAADDACGGDCTVYVVGDCDAFRADTGCATS